MHRSGILGRIPASGEPEEQQLHPRYAAGFDKALLMAILGIGCAWRRIHGTISQLPLNILVAN